jgi:hypothetical protein
VTATTEHTTSTGGQVIPFVRPVPVPVPVLARPGLERGVDETTGTPPGPQPPAGGLADVLDAYARQPDEIAGLVEVWLTTLPDTPDTRRYARAVLHALGELHVALDTAADLARRPVGPDLAQDEPVDGLVDVPVHLPPAHFLPAYRLQPSP